MANWNVLKAAVANIINANGKQEITGQLLQNVLNNIITNVGENATFAGIATLDTNPGAPDGSVFYLATTAGVYPNFNGLEVLDGEAIIFLWNNSAWTKKVTGFATQEKMQELEENTNEKLSQLGSKIGGAEIEYHKGALVRIGYAAIGSVLNINNAKETNEAYRYAVISVKKNTIVTIDAISSSTVGGWCTLNSDSKIVRVFTPDSSGVVYGDVTINETEVCMVLNNRADNEKKSYYSSAESVLAKIENNVKEIESLKNGIENISADISDLQGSIFEKGDDIVYKEGALYRFTKGDILEESNNESNVVYNAAYIQVKDGDVIRINASGSAGVSNSPNPFGVLSVNKSVIDSIKADVFDGYVRIGNKKFYVDDIEVTSSEDIGFIVINNKELDRKSYFLNTSSIESRVNKNTQDIEKIKANEPIQKSLVLKRTSWIATARNYILKEEDGILSVSSDLGVTWNTASSVYGDITFVHWFSDGTMLFCTEKKAYTTKDFSTVNESVVYDIDGGVFVPTYRHFYDQGGQKSRVYSIEGKEAFVWGDYSSPSDTRNYNARIWFTNDNGKTIKCIAKSGFGVFTNGVKHIHNCEWDEYDNCLWITTGDVGSECKVVKGVVSNDTWQFEECVSGDDCKFGTIIVKEKSLLFITDFTDGMNPTGIVEVFKRNVYNRNSYIYAYRSDGNIPYVALIEDDMGNKVLFPDGSIIGKFWMAKGSLDFKEVSFTKENPYYPKTSVGVLMGENYNGETVLCAPPTFNDVTGNEYYNQLKLNTKDRHLLKESLLEAGYSSFCYKKIL